MLARCVRKGITFASIISKRTFQSFLKFLLSSSFSSRQQALKSCSNSRVDCNTKNLIDLYFEFLKLPSRKAFCFGNPSTLNDCHSSCPPAHKGCHFAVSQTHTNPPGKPPRRHPLLPWHPVPPSPSHQRRPLNPRVPPLSVLPRGEEQVIIPKVPISPPHLGKKEWDPNHENLPEVEEPFKRLPKRGGRDNKLT